MDKYKITLVRPSYDSHLITPPLGLGYLSSYLKNRGHEYRIIDGLAYLKEADLVCRTSYHKYLRPQG